MLCRRNSDNLKMAFHPRRRNWRSFFWGGCLFPNAFFPFDTFDACVVFAFSALLAQGMGRIRAVLLHLGMLGANFSSAVLCSK